MPNSSDLPAIVCTDVSATIASGQATSAEIDLVGATEYAHRPIGELSGGEQQRLLIAQAQAEDMVLVSNEELFDGFAVQRLW